MLPSASKSRVFTAIICMLSWPFCCPDSFTAIKHDNFIMLTKRSKYYVLTYEKYMAYCFYRKLLQISRCCSTLNIISVALLTSGYIYTHIYLPIFIYVSFTTELKRGKRHIHTHTHIRPSINITISNMSLCNVVQS